MLNNELPVDTSFMHRFNWSQPEHDLKIVIRILQGHTHGVVCAAGVQEHIAVHKQLASNPNTPVAVLDHMAQCSTSADVLERIANNPSTSPRTFQRLANHQCSEVRCAVAENCVGDSVTVRRLVKDEHTDVRFRLAENHNVPDEILSELCLDENPYVAHRAQVTRARLAGQSVIAQQFNPRRTSLRNAV